VEGLRHPRRAWRARCFTTPKPTGGDPWRCSGRHSFLRRALGPSSGRPCRSTHSRPRPSRGRVGMSLRVGRGPSWAPPRSLPPSIREDRRLSRSGTPSTGEHPSRVFLRACGFAATARPLVVCFLSRDESRSSEIPGHTATEVPLDAVLREIGRRSPTSAIRLTSGHTTGPLDPRYRECPRAPSSSLISVKRCARRCGPAAPRDCSRVTLRTGPCRARAVRDERDR